MKIRILLTAMLLLFVVVGWGQGIDFLDKTDIITLDKKEGKSFVVKFNVTGLKIGEAYHVTISGQDKSDYSKVGIDYKLQKLEDDNKFQYVDKLSPIISSKNIGEFTIYIVPKKDTNDHKALLNFKIFREDGNSIDVEKDITFSNKQKPEKEDKENKSSDIISNLMYLNAYNFDFSSKLNSNYTWHLNLFAPDLDQTKWGFNVGFLKIDYSLFGDSLANKNSFRQVDNLAKSPLDSVVNGTVYYRELNEYSIETKSSSFSIYAQPLFRLTREKSKQKIYAHGHFELYSSKTTAYTTVNTILRDSAIYDQNKRIPVRYNIDGNNIINSSSLLTGYFGLGATFHLKVIDDLSFFAQPTFGFSISGRTFDADSTNHYAYKSNRISYPWFYLTRAHISYILPSKKTSLIIGTDIRGFFPFYSPQFAVYAGINLGVEDVLKLIAK